MDVLKKVSIIGGPGTGKSTLANNIGKVLDVPIYHLDGICHFANWEPRDKKERDEIILSKIESIDTFKIKALEICIFGNSYIFDFISNAESFKIDTINQIKHIIDSTNDEKVLLEFTHSLNEKLEEYKLNEEHPNMTYCKCCGETISKESKYCVHCGQPLPENERDADWILKTLCFLIPPLGLLIYLLNIGEHPKLSNQCLIFSIFGFFIIITIYLSVASILSII